jgi:hypothetical protein
MTLLFGAVLIAAAIVWSSIRIVRELSVANAQVGHTRVLTLLSVFAPAAGAIKEDPRTVFAWDALARTARGLFPSEFASLDRAAGEMFPFGSERIQAAHAQWTADWLAWERAHDAEYKAKAAVMEGELAHSDEPAAARAKLDFIESQKLELYQRRYQEYVQVAKALQGLANAARTPASPSAR